MDEQIEYDRHAEHPQVHVDIRQGAGGLKMTLYINDAALAALTGPDGGLYLHAGSGLFVGDVEVVPNRPEAMPDLIRLEINTGL